MKVKICGLNPVRDVQLCIDLKVNYLGFVFYEKSPRNLVLQDIEVLKNFNKQVSSFVAVTVNAKNEFIENVVLKNFDYIQLHGNESNNRIKEIKSMGIKTIKTVKISEYSDIHQYKNFSEADIILFDTPGMEKSIKFPKNKDGLIRVTFGSFNTKEDAVIALRSIRDSENKYAWILTMTN